MTDGAGHSASRRVGARHVDGVLHESPAAELGQDLRSACTGPILTLKDENARAVPDQESVPAHVERTDAIGGKGVEAVKAREDPA